MINPINAVNSLKRGFKRYIRYNLINAKIECGPNYVSFYVKDTDNTGKQYLTRTSDHQVKFQHIADKDSPWKGDNISIVFRTPQHKRKDKIQTKVIKHSDEYIEPFSITTYQYDNTILVPSDVSNIFRAILSFLSGNGYTDPFARTPKAAKVIPKNAKIKFDTKVNGNFDGNSIGAKNGGYGADYVSESIIKRIIQEEINKAISECERLA